MSEPEKKGFFAKTFGESKSSCCNMHIEEVPEDSTEKPDEQRRGGADAAPTDERTAGSDPAKSRKED